MQRPVNLLAIGTNARKIFLNTSKYKSDACKKLKLIIVIFGNSNMSLASFEKHLNVKLKQQSLYVTYHASLSVPYRCLHIFKFVRVYKKYLVTFCLQKSSNSRRRSSWNYNIFAKNIRQLQQTQNCSFHASKCSQICQKKKIKELLGLNLAETFILGCQIYMQGNCK